MGAVALALAASVVAGSSAGVLVALGDAARGIRPRRMLRERRTPLMRIAFVLAFGGVVAGAFSVGDVERSRPALAATCVATALLVAFAAWLLLVEADDEGDAEIPDEPEWWPAFERDLEDWRRRARVPSSPRI